MLLQVLPMAAQQKASCPEVRVETERLANLNIPRAGHQAFCVNGEIVVAGGHTNGFVPTPTAEFYHDGQWHVLQMVYPHDNGFAVVLKSGKVLLGGGHNEPLGIGQTFLAEMYDPKAHTFDAFCSMERKRALASALELDSGRVVIAGNWYHNDGIEAFDGQKTFTYFKDPSIQRSSPYIFRIANDDAIILSGHNTKGDTLFSTIVDRLKGEALNIPLLETWSPMSFENQNPANTFIGDEAKGQYAYLMAVVDSIGQYAIAKVEGSDIALLPTACPIPMQSHGEQLEYVSPIIADRQAKRAYITALNKDFHRDLSLAKRWYVLCIEYAQTPAALTLYYTDPQPGLNIVTPLLTSGGNLLLTGGLCENSNFKPSNAAFLLRVGHAEEFAAQQYNSSIWNYVLLVIEILLVLLLIYLFIILRKKHVPVSPPVEQEFSVEQEQPAEQEPIATEPEPDTPLMQRIQQLIEGQKLYLRSDLKVIDVATELGINSRYVSDCINQTKGCSFSLYVNRFRIEYAKQLMRNQSQKKVSSVYLEAGFANESSYFRTFKLVTGMTPKEWIATQID